ncbi:hypothetical protein GXW78_12585 [Roseomonas terrae]|uniref:Uncharacterized protein n=1 Tax=Neoroseomonas terrae TaxID=424799 RepID=A0ABS5EHJ1_9PROT|nr:hypothetical protein [Neoroseomonas terrae]MBR0650504.1 hypothetical protein [Neoroseomonas terrae]
MDVIELGRFAVAPDGALTPRAAPDTPALRFAWRGRAVEARFDPESIRLAADAARIPSTAIRAFDRKRAFTAAAALPQRLPAGWRARLLPDHRIRIEAEAPMDSPSNAIALVAALVRFALALDPYLDALEAGGAD